MGQHLFIATAVVNYVFNYSIFHLFIFHKIHYTTNSLDLFTCMCVKISAGPSTVDSHTGSNKPSKETAATYLQKSRNTSSYSLKLCTYLEFGLSLFKINCQGCHLTKYLKLTSLLVGSYGSINFCISTCILIQEN